MSKTYKTEDFAIGDSVVHKTDKKTIMVIVEINGDSLHCRWLNKKGEKQNDDFIAAELIKSEDLPGDIIEGQIFMG